LSSRELAINIYKPLGTVQIFDFDPPDDVLNLMETNLSEGEP